MAADRYEPYRTLARAQQLDAIALVPGSNFARLYNADFHQSERPLLVVVPCDGAPAAIVPSLELNSFDQINFEGAVFDWRDHDGYQNAFDQLMQHLQGIKRLGVEGQFMRVFVHHALMSAVASLEIVDAQTSISSLRLNKNKAEVVALEKAIGVSERALEATLAKVEVGMTEKNLEAILIQNLFAEGADAMSFSPIVAAGDNSARPHAHARDDYKLKSGDALLIDFGARCDGLCADITRTFFIQKCSDRARSFYQTVLAANLAGLAICKPGATAHQVDDETTKVLENSELAEWIIHKTGHGLGRDIHEDPYIMRGNHTTLESGMVFTIEPGLYDPSNYGVRIEDDVLLTDEGCRVLTSFPKELRLVG